MVASDQHWSKTDIGGGGAAVPPHNERKIKAKNLKSSCRMMIEKVMIQLSVYFNQKGNLRC